MVVTSSSALAFRLAVDETVILSALARRMLICVA